eukprot:10939876-Alexandrium_andersonii.AAC.1
MLWLLLGCKQPSLCGGLHSLALGEERTTRAGSKHPTKAPLMPADMGMWSRLPCGTTLLRHRCQRHTKLACQVVCSGLRSGEAPLLSAAEPPPPRPWCRTPPNARLQCHAPVLRRGGQMERGKTRANSTELES